MNPKTRQKTLRLLTNGMYVLTSRDGVRLGAATVTWVSQVSFKPPLLMIAIRKNSNLFRCVRASRIAALHVLGRNDQPIAQKFFSPIAKGGVTTLNGEPFTEGVTSAPILKNLPAYLECKVVEIDDRHGDHALCILEVVEAALREEVHPLTVFDSPWEYGG